MGHRKRQRSNQPTIGPPQARRVTNFGAFKHRADGAYRNEPRRPRGFRRALNTSPGIPGQLGGLELCHRQHARVEDRICQAKAAGLANLPWHGTPQHSHQAKTTSAQRLSRLSAPTTHRHEKLRLASQGRCAPPWWTEMCWYVPVRRCVLLVVRMDSQGDAYWAFRSTPVRLCCRLSPQASLGRRARSCPREPWNVNFEHECRNFFTPLSPEHAPAQWNTRHQRA